MTNKFNRSIRTMLLSLAGLLAFGVQAFAQMTVTGVVYDTEKPTPMTGASVVVDGKNTATITDLDGKFSIKASAGDVLKIQFMGYFEQTVTVGKSNFYEVIMKPDTEQLDEVIVTALGMKREKRSLGYAATDVSGENLTQASSSNWLNGLQGKVAGVQFNGASSGPIGSQRVVVRGESSLSGDSGALFVVDGIPITSGSISNASGALYTNQDAPVDFGDGASDINPDDIESITVLKGAAATALYGSRAGNGAVIITTKSGSKTRGIGVTFSHSTTFDHPGYWPDLQKEYGSGGDNGVSEYNLWYPDTTSEGVAHNWSRTAFGEPFGDGTKMRYQYNGMNWDTMIAERTPWVYADDWFTGIFRTGSTMENSISIEGGNGKGTSVRASIKDTRNQYILPNTGFARQQFSLSVSSEISKAIKINAKANYYRTDSDNMPSSAYNNNSVMYQLVWSSNTNGMQDFYDEYFNGRWNKYNYDEGHLVMRTNYYNPYRTLYEMTNSMDKDRFFGSLGATATITKHLTLDVKAGVDMNNEFRTQRKPKLSYNYVDGWYREQSINIYEINTDFMLKYNNSWIQDKLSFTAGFGGNSMNYSRRTLKTTITALNVDGIYNIDNYPAGTVPDISAYRSQKVVNSLYGLLSLGWQDWAYIDVTGRNDWSSTLAKGYWSYFYPSVSGSLVIDKLANFHANAPWFTFLKLRASWANVGKDTNPYSLDYSYTSTLFPGGYELGATSPKIDLKPENVETVEVGIEAKFLQNRIGFDVAVYQSDATNQIYDVPYDYITGSKYYTQNIGLIRNKGIEISASFVPVKTKNWTWTVNMNATRYVSILERMYDGWDNDTPYESNYVTTIGGRFHIYNFVGEKMGDMYGYDVPRAATGSYILDENGNRIDCSGAVIINESDGLPGAASANNPEGYNNYSKVGNINPDWLGGLSTSLRWKDLTLNMTFSAQLGGDTYSVTQAILGYQGKLTSSLPGRYDGLIVDGVNYVGVDEKGTAIYKKNTVLCTDVNSLYSKGLHDRYNANTYTYDTSFFKLKELRLEYRLPKTLIEKQKVLQGASLAFFATNLFCITNYPLFDPEAGTLVGSNVKRGLESGSFPMNRSYGFNLKLQF
ncbi:MAG: SusC/RagA family TonB-linked outer membrane protein [Bacteroidales bacterium]|nr:SusC/RagA family TonB-linked outer membrane protein [Bacteroidales bacterium]